MQGKKNRAKGPQKSFQSGYIAIVGRPNVGKSTLLNQILAETMVIVSPKPQTTRNRILGIKHLPGAQMIFVDTPGLHDARGKFHQFMTKEAIKATHGVDAMLLLIEANESGKEDNLFIIDRLANSGRPIFLLINKIDTVKKDRVLILIEEYMKLYPFTQVIPISALLGDGIDTLIREILKVLPEGPPYFPDDQITDRSERFIVAEIVREKVFHLFGQEVPYSVAVTVEEFKERKGGKATYIKATIYTEKDSQKGILIGKGGVMLKKVGQLAREEIERFFGTRVFLDLWVKVQRNWTKDEKALKKFGYQ
jgi:GTP-binding protein Era